MGTEIKTCDFCHSEEGKLRPIGQYNVVLTHAVVNGQSIYACQSCRVNNREIFAPKQIDVEETPKHNLNPSLLQKLKEKLSKS